MVPAILGDAKFWSLLLRFDEDLAAGVRARGCPHCGAALHGARYPRKPRGAGRAVLGEGYAWRLSFCCAREGCRRRTTAPSVRFLGRRVYLGALVVLVCALSQGLSGVRQAQLREWVGVSARTLRRWQRWWREVLPATRWWRGAQGQLAAPVEPARLPASLLERFEDADAGLQLLGALVFLSPLSVAFERAR